MTIRRCRLQWLVALSLCLGVEPWVWAQTVTQGRPAPVLSDRISLDLKGVDILDVLKLLSQKSGLNFVAGRNVSGRVTIFVNDVGVWEAFERIVEANDLAYERQGDIVTVMTARDYELLFGERFQERKESAVLPLQFAKVAQLSPVLNQVKSTIGRVVADEASNTIILNDVPVKLAEMRDLVVQLDQPTNTRVYQLNYAKAEEVKEKIQEMLSQVGTQTADERTNTIVVTDLRDVLQQVDRIVRAFDLPDGQVLIDAKIINVELNDDTSLGIDWKRVFGGIDAETRLNFLSREVVTGSVLSGDAFGGTVQLVPSGGSSKLIVEALQRLGKTETLANPRIMVSEGQEAKILVGTKEVFITTTTTVPEGGQSITAQDVEEREVGTKLFVTPSIKRDGFVQLKIRPEVSSVARTIETTTSIIPVVKTTEAETSVLIKSGTTLVIGGLIDNSTVYGRDQLPVVGKMPVIGLPFRSTTDQVRKSELVVLLTPEILLPDGSRFEPPPPTPIAQIEEPRTPPIILRDPVPPVYSQAVRRRLQELLHQRFKQAFLSAGSVILAFTLNQDGSLRGTPEISSPQGDPFVEAAREGLAQALPFAPFPEGSTGTEVRFRIAVAYAP